MHEITESGTSAFAHLVLTAASFTKIGYRRELGINGASAEPTIVQVFGSFFRIFFTTKLEPTKMGFSIEDAFYCNCHLENRYLEM